MTSTTITIHLGSHRRKSLKTEGETPEAVQAYDHNIGDYIHFLKDLASGHGIELKTDQQELDNTYSINAGSHEAKIAAHDWLHDQPDLWNWIP